MEPHLTPPGFGVTEQQEPNPKPITLEETIARQIDRINYLRSTNTNWSEAVFALRDTIVGLEDQEFWDGLTPNDRERLKDMTPNKIKYLQEQRANNGWDTMPMDSHNGLWYPTNAQTSNALRIILRLLSRQGLTWKKKNISQLTNDHPIPPSQN